MPKIENYQIKTVPLTPQDKWIGTDSSGNITKNFTPENIASFINNTDLVTIAGQSIFKWQNSAGPRELGSISYTGFGGGGDDLSTLTSLLISDTNFGESYLGDYLPTLIGQNIILAEVNAPNNFMIGQVTNLVPHQGYPGFNTMLITPAASHGAISGNALYALAIYPGAPAILPPGNGTPGTDANYVHDQGLASDTWQITHGLNKYPSCTIVDTAGTQIMGQVDFIDTNSLTISLSAASAGKAYIN